MSGSLPIPAAPGERVDRFRRREVEPQAQQLRHRLEALADVAEALLQDARPALPDELNDRAWDGVEPLLAIAELAGGDWPGLARAACVELYGGRQVEDESTGIRLLSDIRDVFGEDDRVTTTTLLDRLNALEEAPWCDWFGKPLTHRGLAKLLDRYRIKSRNVRLPDGKTPKGFPRAQFEGAWARYLSPNPPQRHNPHSAAENSEFESATGGSVWRKENSRNPAPGAGCGGVADRGPSEGENAVSRDTA